MVQEQRQVTEDEMLEVAENVFKLVAQTLYMRMISVQEAFGGDDMIHLLQEFQGETDVQVMTCDDFFTRCLQLGMQ